MSPPVRWSDVRRTGDALVRIRVDLSYDGSGFHGFAENRDVETVGGRLRAALERVLRHPVELTCAGRTDAGVHARGQVVSFDTTVEPEPERWRDSLNGLLGPRIVVRDVRVADPDFDARFSARSRTYRYTVLNRPVPDPFLAATAWWVPEPLDLTALAEACPPLLGEHDFSSFCRRPRGRSEVSLVRRVLAAGWRELPSEDGPGLLGFEISSSSFCHQMVRSVVGLLVDVGRGRRTPADVAAAIAARDRSRVAQLAPPHGLVLWEVGY
jgi:tRNA pseudouridine38-40 synthase